MADVSTVTVRPARALYVCNALIIAVFVPLALGSFTVRGSQGSTDVADLIAAVFWVLAASAGIAHLVALRISSRRADPKGFAWRDALGRHRAVAWDFVVDLRESERHGFYGPEWEVELRDGCVVSWPKSWVDAESLQKSVSAAIGRGVYRGTRGHSGGARRLVLAAHHDDRGPR